MSGEQVPKLVVEMLPVEELAEINVGRRRKPRPGLQQMFIGSVKMPPKIIMEIKAFKAVNNMSWGDLIWFLWIQFKKHYKDLEQKIKIYEAKKKELEEKLAEIEELKREVEVLKKTLEGVSSVVVG